MKQPKEGDIYISKTRKLHLRISLVVEETAGKFAYAFIYARDIMYPLENSTNGTIQLNELNTFWDRLEDLTELERVLYES
jgi:hypothetical protein